MEDENEIELLGEEEEELTSPAPPGGFPWLLLLGGGVIFVLILAAVVLAVFALRSSGWIPGPKPTPGTGPTLTVLPAEGGPGTLVTVIGRRWQPGETVFIGVSAPKATEAPQAALTTAVVKEDGSFAAAFAFPPDPALTGLPEAAVVAWSPTTARRAQALFRLAAAGPTATLAVTATPSSTLPTATPTPTVPSVIVGWRGEYYANRDLTGAPALVQDDAELSFNWGDGGPAAGLPVDLFSARWTRSLNFSAGTYRFYALSDDGVRLWVDGQLVIDQWHNAAGVVYAVDQALAAGTHSLRVEYYENLGRAALQVWWERLGDFPQWRGEYFNQAALSGAPVLVRNDVAVDFNWGRNSPASGLPADQFSVRWTRTLPFDAALYRFHVQADDGVRLWVDGALLVNEWRNGTLREMVVDYRLAAGYHLIQIDYYEASDVAAVRVWWEKGATYPDWRGEFWPNSSQAGGPVLIRNDTALDFTWGQAAPDPVLPVDNFSARWTRAATFEAATYRFHILVDDGARLWVDNQPIIDEWRDGSPREVVTDLALSVGAHTVQVDYYEKKGNARLRVWWEKVAQPTYPDWKGEYWSNPNLSGNPVLVRNDPKIDFVWGTKEPASGLPSDNFSVRWSRTLALEAGIYRFSARADDGIRLYVDNTLYLSEWHTSSGDRTYVVDLPLVAGNHKVVVEYFEGTGGALAQVWVDRVGDLVTPTVTPVPSLTATPTLSVPTPTSTPPVSAPTPTWTPSPTDTPPPSPTATPTPSPTPTPTPTVPLTP